LDTCIFAHLFPLGHFSEQAPKRACTSFFSPSIIFAFGRVIIVAFFALPHYSRSRLCRPGRTGYQPPAFLRMCLDDHSFIPNSSCATRSLRTPVYESFIHHTHTTPLRIIPSHLPLYSLSSRATLSPPYFFLLCPLFTGSRRFS